MFLMNSNHIKMSSCNIQTHSCFIIIINAKTYSKYNVIRFFFIHFSLLLDFCAYFILVPYLIMSLKS